MGFYWFKSFIVVIDVFDFEINIENLVLLGSFSEGIDLGVANSKLYGSSNRKNFSGLVYKLKNPKATFLLFKNGKFVCTGTKTKTQGKKAITNLLTLLKVKGIVSNHCTFRWCVKNLVASIDLSGATTSPQQFISEFDALFEPDKFPATIHKTNISQASFLFFLTGKIICSGATDKENLKQIIQKLFFAPSETNQQCSSHYREQ